MYKLGHQEKVVVSREEPGLDRACDLAFMVAKSIFAIDGRGHTTEVEGWEPSSCLLMVRLEDYVRAGSNHQYIFTAWPEKSEEPQDGATEVEDDFIDYPDVLKAIRSCGMTQMPAVLCEVLEHTMKVGSFKDNDALVSFVSRRVGEISANLSDGDLDREVGDK